MVMVPPRLGLLLSVILVFVAVHTSECSAASEQNRAEIPETVISGGLSCFTVEAPAYDPNKKTSCDEMCGEKSYACTGVTSAINPPPSCSSPASFLKCRCCKIVEKQ